MPNEIPTWEETSEVPTWESTHEPSFHESVASDLTSGRPERIAGAVQNIVGKMGEMLGTGLTSSRMIPPPKEETKPVQVPSQPWKWPQLVPPIEDITGSTRPLKEIPGYVANVSRAIPADVAAGMSLFKRPEGQPKTLLPSPTAIKGAIHKNLPAAAESSGNIPAALSGEAMPIDAILSAASKEDKTAATIGKISNGLAATAPMAAIATLPAAAQKLALIGFTAKMMSDAPELATQLGEELGKPEDQRDPDKLTTLISDAVQVVGFSTLGAKHLISRGLKTVNDYAKDLTPRGQGINFDLSSFNEANKPTTGAPNAVQPTTTQPVRGLRPRDEAQPQGSQVPAEVSRPKTGVRGSEGQAQAQPGLADVKPSPEAKPAMADWIREAMIRAGLDPNRTFNDVDLANASVREAIQLDPTLTAEQKTQLLKTGSLKPSPQVHEEAAQPPPPPPAQPVGTEAGKAVERPAALTPDDLEPVIAGDEKGYRPIRPGILPDGTELKSGDVLVVKTPDEIAEWQAAVEKWRSKYETQSAPSSTPEPPASQKPAPPAPTSEEKGGYTLYEKADPTAPKGKRYIIAAPDEYGIKLSAKQSKWKKVGRNLTREEAFSQQQSRNAKAGITQPTPPPTAGSGEKPISEGPGAASPGDKPKEPPQAATAAEPTETATEQNRPAGIVASISTAIHNLESESGNILRGLAGKSLPRITKAHQPTGEIGVEYASSRIAARPRADLFSASVLEGTDVDPVKFGAALVEDNLASVREGFRQRATELLAEGDEAGAAKATENADNVRSIVGAKGSPFKTWDEYQDFLAEAATKTALAKHIQQWQETIEPQYKAARRIDPDVELPTRGQQTGARINLKAILPGEPGAKPVSSVDFPRITGTFRRQTPFATKAKGTGETYEVLYPEIIANTFEKQLEIANKNRFDNALVESGLAEIHRPGWQGTINGQRVTSFPLKRGSRSIKTSDGETVPVNQSVNLYIRSDLANEYRAASNVDAKYRVPYLTSAMNLLNRTALAGLTDFTVHTSNLMTALFNRPISGGLFKDTLLSATGRADVPVAIVKAIIKAGKNNQKQLAELAEIGALRASADSPGMLGWSGKVLKSIDRTVRLTLDDTFQQLAKDGIVEDTPTNRREFVNQVGQYNRRLQGQFTRFLRDTGFGPFATAGKTFNALGVRMMTLSPGAKATSFNTAAALRVNAATKWVGLAVLSGTLNYLLTKDKGGGVSGRPGTPLGSVDTGLNDKNGKPLYFPLADVIGLGRGMRVTGTRGFVEAKRMGLDTPTAVDAAARDIVNAAVGPAAGPPVRFASVAATGKAPAMSVGRVSPVAPPGENQLAVNVEQALLDANPVVASIRDLVQGKSIAESASRQIPRFTMKPGKRTEMVEKYPEIVEKAKAREFEDWIIHQARGMPMKERQAFIAEQIQRLPVDQRDHAWKQMQWRGVFKYQ